MNEILSIIRLLINDINIYNKYYKLILNYIDTNEIVNSNKELNKILITINSYYSEFKRESISCEELVIHFLTLYPATSRREKETLDVVVEKISQLEANPAVLEDYLKSLQVKSEASRIALKFLEVGEGRGDWENVSTAFLEASRAIGKDPAEELSQSEFVSNRLSELYEQHYKKPGLRWRLRSMNRMLGSLRKGDFGFMFARPETGKTSLLASEATFMAPQIGADDPPILWFNNEQVGAVVQFYLYRAHLGLTDRELFANIAENERRYLRDIGDRIRVYDQAVVHRKQVEDVLNRHGASLIIFDQLDKVAGFEADREDLTLGAKYKWARELAKIHGPVVAVCQAGESGANKRWLTMEDVVNAKTAKQAEADWILGIGKVNQEGHNHLRHLHLSKNKLQGDEDSHPEMRHGKCDVIIHQEISRYEDCPE